MSTDTVGRGLASTGEAAVILFYFLAPWVALYAMMYGFAHLRGAGKWWAAKWQWFHRLRDTLKGTP